MNNYTKIYINVLLFFVFSGILLGQNPRMRGEQGMRGSSISGQVIDANTGQPIEYAYAILYNQSDSIQVTGTITDSDGFFRLAPVFSGEYYLEIHFMGYHSFFISDLKPQPRTGPKDVGMIELEPAILSTEQIEVEGEKAAIAYQIDKKVINVAENLSVTSGSAIDVLENVPSVTVDIEGNVSLRGSGSFVVLVDNLPSILEPNEILEQIPASSIENIEIITNPSAKYDPDGTSGIINIITKKNELRGVSGILDLDGGLDEKYAANVLLSYRENGKNFYLSVDYRNQNYPSFSETEHRSFFNDTTNYIFSDGRSSRLRNGYGFRGGMDWSIAKNDLFSIGFRYGARGHESSTNLDYDEWTDPGLIHNLYLSREFSERGGDYYSTNIDYKHSFSQKEHVISGQIQFSKRNGDEKSVNELWNKDNELSSGRETREEGPSSNIRTKLDYVLPLSDKYRFESGYQSRLGTSTDKTKLLDLDPLSGGYVLQPLYSHEFEYERNIHSLYSLFAGEAGDFGFQGGLRGEYTYRNINAKDQNQSFKIDRWDYFPTAHFSYTFSKGKQTMMSYTRRIDRPRGWYLEPFETWSDAYNIRVGNPALKPEYIDSYEMGYQTYFGANLFSTELYYRVTHNKIERVRSAYNEQVTLHSTENVGKDYTFGSEVMLNIDLLPQWNMNLMGNLYDYRVEGILYGRDFSRSSFSWSTRMNNTIKFGKNTRIQVNGNYNSPRVSSQGESKENFSVSLGVRQEFWNRQLALTLQIRDLLQTADREYISEGQNFYTYSYSQRKSPVVMLNLRYNINNYKERKREDGQENGMDEEDF